MSSTKHNRTFAKVVLLALIIFGLIQQPTSAQGVTEAYIYQQGNGNNGTIEQLQEQVDLYLERSAT